jgi:hypothetical protein
MVSVTAVSVFTAKRQMLPWLTHSKLESMSKETVGTYSSLVPNIWLDIARTVILESHSRETHDDILPSQDSGGRGLSWRD